ncbi:MAG: hypothetical protein WKG32_03645 [Gemmatimonadaceae bacterium]
MNHDAIIIVNAIVGTLFATTVGFAVAWLRTRERAIRAELTRGRLPQDSDARFDQLQQAVDAMAVEVERISEGQRFATKLLADRARVPEALTPLRVITPH